MSSSRLLGLPAELRNHIYELACTVKCREQPVDLLWSQPPSSALLSCCRQTYQEARTLFLEASRHYWSNQRCYIDNLRLSKRGKQHLSELQAYRRLGGIKSLIVATRGVVSRHGTAYCYLNLIDPRGGWHREVFRMEGAGRMTHQEDYVVMLPREEVARVSRPSLQVLKTAEELKDACNKQVAIASMEMQILAAIAMLETWVASRNA